MRISSFQIHSQASERLQTLGADAAKTQERISHGKRLVTPSDDPVGAARLVGINQELRAREQFIKNVDSVDAQLALEDSTLQQVTETIQRVQELVIQAGSGVQSMEDRGFIAVEIEARFEELMSLVNSKDAHGQFLFSGFQGEQVPFVQEGETVVYRGDAGTRSVQIDRGQYVTLNDSGQELFMRVPVAEARPTVGSVNAVDLNVATVEVIDQQALEAFYPDKLVVEFNELAAAGGSPNYTVRRQSDLRPVDGLENVPYASGGVIAAGGLQLQITGTPQAGDSVVIDTSRHQSIFETVQGIADGLREVDPSVQPDSFRDLIDDTIDGLNSATEVLLQVRADVGSRFNSVSAAKDRHLDLELQLQSLRSEIEDLDFAEAVSDLSFQSFVLEAAQQSFVRISDLSLFNRLR